MIDIGNDNCNLDMNYIFDEKEFEVLNNENGISNKEFDPHAFVKKYRNVTTIDNLKSELQHYRDCLNNQLSNIINKDYKNFIALSSTNLDGIDNRLIQMITPLQDMHDNCLIESMEHIQNNVDSMQSKIEKKKSIQTQRSVLLAMQRCDKALHAAKMKLSLVGRNTSDAIGTKGSGSCDNKGEMDNTNTILVARKLYIQYKNKLKMNPCSNTVTNPNAAASYTHDAVMQLIYTCRDWEACAVSLSVAKTELNCRLCNSSLLNQEYSVIVHQLNTEADALCTELLQTLRNKLSQILDTFYMESIHLHVSGNDANTTVVASGTENSGTNPDPNAVVSKPLFNQIAFRHIIRAILYVESCQPRQQDGSTLPIVAVETPKCSVIFNVIEDFVLQKCIKQVLTIENIDSTNLSFVNLESNLNLHSKLGHAEWKSHPLHSVYHELLKNNAVFNNQDQENANEAEKNEYVKYSYSGLYCINMYVLAFVKVFLCTDTSSDALGANSILDIIQELMSVHDTSDTKCTQDKNFWGYDLLVRSVYVPYLRCLDTLHNSGSSGSETGSMTGITVPSVFHMCYSAMFQFAKYLNRFTHTEHLHCIIRADLSTKWKMNIYYQLRVNEVCARVNVLYDMVCSKQLPEHSGVGSTNNASKPDSIKPVGYMFQSKVEGASLVPYATLSPAAASLHDAQLTAMMQHMCYLCQQTPEMPIQLNSQFISSMLIEIQSIVEDSIYLCALSSEFVTLIIKIVNRLCLFVKQVYCPTPPLFDMNGGFDAQKAQTTEGTIVDMLHASMSVNDHLNTSTELLSLRQSTSATELLRLSSDIIQMSRYIHVHFVPTLIQKAASESEMKDMTELRSLIEHCFDRQCDKLWSCVKHPYNRLAILTCYDCISIIQAGVESVPTKYRMTNKAPPTSHNLYAEHILDSLKEITKDETFRHIDSLLNAIDKSNPDACVSILSINRQFIVNCINILTHIYLTYVEKTLRVVKDLDGRLNKRNQQKTTAMSDSDKIMLQLFYDFKYYIMDVYRYLLHKDLMHGTSLVDAIDAINEQCVRVLDSKDRKNNRNDTRVHMLTLYNLVKVAEK